MWKTTNYKGETVTWYSEQEYNELKEKELKMQKTVLNILKLIPVIITGVAVGSMWICIINSCIALNNINGKLDRLIELNQPEAIQLIVPDKPLLEDK